jgi:hypothetical protein
MTSVAIASTVALVSPAAADMLHDAINGSETIDRAGRWFGNKFNDVKDAFTKDATPNTTPDDSHKGGNIGGGHEPTEPTKTGTIDKPVVQPKALTYDQIFDGNRGTTHLTDAGKADFAKWLHGREVERGDSIWKLAEQYQNERHIKSSVFSTDALKDFGVKHLQANGSADSRGWLNKGDIIK